jgi:5-methylcytosine-specific restriction endonuclease McrA
VPSIIMLRRFHKFQNYVKFSRSNVFLRDMYRCQYCGNIFDLKQLTLDHVIPRSKGGLTNWENIVTCCKGCNTAKGSKIIKPINEPKKPSFAHLLNGHKLNKNDFPDQAWADYIF